MDTRTIDTVVIGAGHAGLAVSRCLTDRAIEHVVLERGQVGERWCSARWDSFRLLTPNWLARLPGWAYAGGDPDGFMDAAQFAGYLRAYASSFDAPVLPGTTVLEVRAAGDRYLIATDRGGWSAANVVIATGYHARARVPAHAAGITPDVAQITPDRYREPTSERGTSEAEATPDWYREPTSERGTSEAEATPNRNQRAGRLPDGAVLVVGASASGVQIADDLVRAGRRVVLAVGGHTRLPRTYRGRDILWWLDRSGSLDRTADDMADPDSAQWETSLQLAGTGRAVDLGALQDRGVRLAGRLVGVEGDRARFADDLAETTAAADARMRGVLARLDRWAAEFGIRGPGDPVPAVRPARGPDHLDLRRAGVAAVVWATGFRPWYPWLAVPVLDRDGLLQHRRGVTAAPGLYAIGLKFQYRRRSTFIDGVGEDAAYLVDHIAARCRRRMVGS
jgi:putative flavoprotein involved in K+ transport